MKKLNQHGIAHWILPLVVVAVIAVIGVVVLKGSHADAPVITNTSSAYTTSLKTVEFFNSSNAVITPGVSVVPAPVDNLGNQNVLEVESGSQLTFNGSNLTGAGTTACYFVQVVPVKGETTETAKVEFTSPTKSVTKNLTYSSTQTDNFTEVCVGSGGQTNKGFNVANLTPTGPDLSVYQEILSW
jgi:hypothetical protein